MNKQFTLTLTEEEVRMALIDQFLKHVDICTIWSNADVRMVVGKSGNIFLSLDVDG